MFYGQNKVKLFRGQWLKFRAMIETHRISFNSDIKSILGFHTTTFKNRKNNHLICKCLTVLRNSTLERLKAPEQ